MRYFKKELVKGNPLYLANGRKAPFEDVGGDNGFLATDDGWVTQQLEAAIQRGVGGVLEISFEQFEDQKKNPSGRRSLQTSARDELRRLVPSLRQQGSAVGLPLKQPPPLPPNPSKGGTTPLDPARTVSVVRPMSAIKSAAA